MITQGYLPAMQARRRNFKAFDLRRPIQKFKLPILLTLAHVPLGVLLYNSSKFGLIHPLLVFFLGMRCAYRRQEKLSKVGAFVAYLIGSEILWRMAHVPIFWESGKYASAAIMIIALARRGCWKIPTPTLLFILFLVPSCILTVFRNEFSDARDMLSFNMSGPFLLFVSCWFCAYLKIDLEQVKIILFALIVPLSTVAVTTLFYTVTTENIIFNTESNHATSGGFGPNQVSAMLGLGAFLCIAACLVFKNRFAENIYLGLFILLFTAQSVMTFSRGGMYNAFGATLGVVLFQILNPGQSIKRMLPIVAAAALFIFLIFPFLNDFTGGKLEERFEETDTANRGGIVEADFEIFAENPFFGVGVGESFFEYERLLNQVQASHTEFSRLLSEHGFFGILAMACLVLTCLQNLIRQNSTAGKALAAGFFVWSCLFMLNTGMRLAAPAYILGLSCITVNELQPRVKRNSGKNLKRRRGNL